MLQNLYHDSVGNAKYESILPRVSSDWSTFPPPALLLLSKVSDRLEWKSSVVNPAPGLTRVEQISCVSPTGIRPLSRQVPIIYLLVSHRCMNYRSQCSACGADQHFPNWWPGGNGGGSGKWKISVTREGAALVSRSTTNPVQCKPLRQLTVHRNSPSGQRTNASNEQSREQAIKLQSKVFSLKGKRGLEFNLLIPHFLCRVDLLKMGVGC